MIITRRQITLLGLLSMLSPVAFAQHATVLSGDQSDFVSGTASGTADVVNEVAPGLMLKSGHIRKYLPAYSERATQRVAQQAKQALKQAEQQVKLAKKAAGGAKPGSQAAINYDKAKARLKQYQGLSKKLNTTHMQAVKQGGSKRKGLVKLVNKRTVPISRGTRWGVKNAGVIFAIADVGSTLSGHIVEGNYSGAVGAGVNEIPKAGASTVGGMIGGAVGVFGGPPGIAIGTVVGSVGGAYVYSLVVGDTVAKLAEESVTSEEDSALQKALKSRAEFLADKQAYLDKARKNRAEFLRKQQLAQAKTSKGGFWDEPTESSTKPSVKPPPQARAVAPVPAKPRKRKETAEDRQKRKQALKDKARRKAAVGIDPNREFDSTPVIEQDLTIDAVIWNAEYPQEKFNITYYIRGGQVSGSLRTEIPGHSNEHYRCEGSSIEWVSSGQLIGNVLHTKSQGTYEEPIRCIHHGMRGEEPYTCETVYNSKSSGSGKITLNIDGSLVENGSSTWDNHQIVTGNNCSWKDSSNSGDSAPHQLLGIWQKRD